MGIDYRPSNYFGVTGINVIPAAERPAASQWHADQIKPKGNFSLQALLYRLGELSNGVFDQRLISVIERATRYVDGLEPAAGDRAYRRLTLSPRCRQSAPSGF